MRWVQETAECIASVADPATFVLDNPQNVRVLIAQVVYGLLKVFKLHVDSSKLDFSINGCKLSEC